MSSKLTIFNKALLACAQSGLLSTTEGTSPQHNALNLHYTDTLRELLSMRPWTFAQRYAELTANAWDAENPPAGFTSKEKWSTYYVPKAEWAYSHTLPADYIGGPRLCWHTRTPRSDQRIPFTVVRMSIPGVTEGRPAANVGLLYCDQPEVALAYTSNSVEPEAFDPQFESCLIYLLASRVAIAVGAGPNIMKSCFQQFQYALPDANVASLLEAQDDPEPPCSLLSGRR